MATPTPVATVNHIQAHLGSARVSLSHGELVPDLSDQNPWAQSRRPMDMMAHGWSTSLFQASQQWSRMSLEDRNTRLESQFSRMNCQTFSTGLSSGHFGGKGMSVMLGGTTSCSERCQPAWSSRSTAWAPGATAAEISARCKAIAAVLQRGSTRAAALPSFGQMAPKM